MSRETPEENNDEEEYWDDYEPDQEHAEVYFYPGMPTTTSSVREISKQYLLVLFCLPYIKFNILLLNTYPSYFYLGDEVQDCCPAVIYRVLPCMAGDEASPFWEAWNIHRLLGSR